MIKDQCRGFLSTPPIWIGNQFDIQQFEFPDLDLNSFEPQMLPQNIRLGHQMEYVFKQLVEYSEHYEVVLHNLPIRDELRTLGEIDFILKDINQGTLIHVELTCKFYIIDHSIGVGIHSLIGPNRRDSFFLKKEKIKNIQFSLLHSEAGVKALDDINIDHTTIIHQCCFKAQLFQAYGSSNVEFGPLNIACVVGYWIRIEEFNTTEFASAQYYIPSKSEWVISPYQQVSWRSHSEILSDISNSILQNYASMLWMRREDTSFEKLFVVWW